MSQIVGIDPGPDNSAAVVLDEDGRVCELLEFTNEEMVDAILVQDGWNVAIEDFVPYGKSLSHESMATKRWMGIFWYLSGAVLIPRPDIKEHLCDTRTAKDADVRDALIHRYGANRKGAIGTLKTPGPLYGVKGHLWAALAVAVTHYDGLQDVPVR